MIGYTLFLGLLASTQAWVVKINVDEITPGDTRNVELVCQTDNSQGGTFQISKISRVRITKLDPFGTALTFAEIREHENGVAKNVDHVTVTGDIDNLEKAFLRVAWPIATKDTTGAYGCDVDGFDSQQNFRSIKVNPTMVRETVLTKEDVKGLIKQAVMDNEKKQQTFEREINQLKSVINNDLKSIKQQIQDFRNELIVEISKVDNMAKSTFVTHDQLSKQVSDIKAFATREIASDNKNDEIQHDELQKLIDNTNKSCQTEVSELRSELSQSKSSIESRVESVVKKNEMANQASNARIKSLETKVNSVDVKYEDIIANLRQNLTAEVAAVASGIAKVGNNVQSTFVTQDQLSKQVSDIKAFAISEIASDNKNDEIQHDELQKLIDNTNKSCQAEVSVLRSELSQSKSSIDSRVESVVKKNEMANQASNARIKSLETKVNSVDVKYEDIIADLRQNLTAEVAVVASGIAKVGNNVQSTFVTQDQLSKQVSDIKAFAISEIASDNKNDEIQHDELQKLIDNINKSCQSEVSGLRKDLFNSNTFLESKLESLNKKSEKANQASNTKIKNLETKVNLVDAKYEDIFADLRHNLTELAAGNCLCSTEPSTPVTKTPQETTTPPVTPLAGSVWPGGSYALVKPRLGCPALTFSTVNDPLHMARYSIIATVERGSKTFDLAYCAIDTQQPSSLAWPSGSYCIGKTESSCPHGFNTGTILFNAEGSTYTNSIKIETKYCCRSDGRYLSPIALPKDKPFYLYR